jgi:antirestriction protein ArdC
VSQRAPPDRTSLYEDITSKILAELEAGRLPWVQPWGSPGVSAPLGIPRNAATGRNYSGINVLILWGAVVQHGYAVQSWLTFRQTVGLGGNVRKGERGTTVVYADRFVPDDERQRAHHEGEAPRAIPFLKRFTVFNVAQCEGLPEDVAANAPPVATDLILPQVEELIRATGADVRIGGDKAYYDVAGDFIRVPPPQAFFEPINWHRTTLHELGHLVGRRLGRDLSGAFGSKKYAYEEIVWGTEHIIRLRRAGHRADGATCRLHRQLVRNSARKQSRHRPGRIRGVEGRGLPACVPAGCCCAHDAGVASPGRKRGDRT